ncbi:MAG: peptide deformylase [Alistipes sp.]|nr:peptide deformylase [Alistipes sp.]
MKRLLIMIAATLGLAACGETFTAAEREVIHADGHGIMRVLSIDNEADSLALREESRPMSESLLRTEEYALLRERMLQTVQNPEAEGVGIAAPQVGVRRAVIAVQRFDKEGEPFEFFLNPEIIELLGEKADGGEGCLSVPELYGNVSRWQHILLRYRDEQWVEHTEYIEGFTAVIFQHEVDHLSGRLFIDYLSAEGLEEPIAE